MNSDDRQWLYHTLFLSLKMIFTRVWSWIVEKRSIQYCLHFSDISLHKQCFNPNHCSIDYVDSKWVIMTGKSRQGGSWLNH